MKKEFKPIIKDSTLAPKRSFVTKLKTRLSKLFANYIKKNRTGDDEEQILPLVKTLVGVLKKDKKSWKEHRNDYTNYLIKKYN